MGNFLLAISCFFLVPVGMARAQQGMGNYAGDLHRQGNDISFVTTRASVHLDFCTPKMFRVRVSWNGFFPGEEHWMVNNYHWKQVRLRIDTGSNSIQLYTDQLKIVLRKSPYSMDVFTAEGDLLSSESNIAAGDGGSFRQGDTVGCKKMMMPDEHFFGFGERMDFLDRRGKRVNLEVGRGEAKDNMMGAYNTLEANYCPLPFFMSTKGYGIFLHNPYKSTWDMGEGEAGAYSFKADGGAMDYYFIAGPEFTDILKEYTSLTGRSPLLPEFALGLHAGTYSGGTWGHEELASAQYVLALIRRFRDEGIPIDLLFLDSTWRLFASGGHGATTFEWRDTFGDPKRMFDSLYAMHLHAVGLHIRPRLDNGPKYHLLDAAQAAGITYPEQGHPGEFPNFFDTTAVRWWWDHAVMKVASIGAKFLKTDEGSAFGRKANESNKTGPGDSTALSLHNIFPLAYAAAPYRKFQDFNGIRGMNQTREGYAGIQRYPYIFAGDWPSQWQFFAPVIKAGLNIGLSGVGYWAHCMGGFEQPADPELYIRWCQFGLLSPIALVFGMDHPGYKEPWNYGTDGLRNFKKYDSLRYCLLPYLYTTAHELFTDGQPMMRALVLNYQHDENVYGIGDQYLLGDNLMICPVTTKGARTRVVYLPAGTWFNFWTGEKYQGKKYLTVACSLDQIPIFVKGGGIIPMQPEMQYTGEKAVDTLTWEMFPEGASSYQMYTDDGSSLKYLQGDYALTKISSLRSKDLLSITLAKPEGRYLPAKWHYRLRIHTRDAPVSVTEEDRPLAQGSGANHAGWYYDSLHRILQVFPDGSNRDDIHVQVHFKLRHDSIP